MRELMLFTATVAMWVMVACYLAGIGITLTMSGYLVAHALAIRAGAPMPEAWGLAAIIITGTTLSVGVWIAFLTVSLEVAEAKKSAAVGNPTGVGTGKPLPGSTRPA